MPLIERRTLAGFLVGALTAGAAASAGAAAAFNNAPQPTPAPRAVAPTPAPRAAATTVKACFNRKTGALVFIGSGARRHSCRRTERKISWAIRGPAGPTAPTDPKGTLHLESENGQFVIDVSNFGIAMKGPGTSLTVDRQGIHQQTPFGG